MPFLPIVDVVIPVYDACDDLVACIASVREHTERYRLILIDDGSPDPRIGALFERIAAERRDGVVLLRNARNLGFVATANRGMAHGQDDVVLLNSDTLVTPHWLDRLRRCAQSDARIGTITPFSNNAEICSFPRFCENNAPPADPSRVAAAMALAAVPVYPELPTAVGFCMYIRRRVIETIGVFDPAFGRGYGEENDFSMRARGAGFRNVLCDDAFVVHLGARSFGVTMPARVEENVAKVVARHPDYLIRVREFIAKDPLAPIRSMAASQLAVQAGVDKTGVLHIVHPRGGGTEKYVQEAIATSRDRCRHYVLRILPDRWRLTDTEAGTEAAADVSYDALRPGEDASPAWLRAMCDWLRIDAAHVHSAVGSGDDLVTLLQRAGVPYCYSAHDMYLACPTVYLIDHTGRYCNATTDLATCRACIAHFEGFDHDIEGWRRRYRTFLDGAGRILAPSRWAQATLEKYYPGIVVTRTPHEPPQAPAPRALEVANGLALPRDDRRHIGVLGAIGPEKGSRRLEALVERIRTRGLPLRFVVIGYTDRDNRCQSDDHVFTVHGRYEPGEIEALFDHYRIPLTFFPTEWPETFSYTLSEAWQAGRPALVPPRGALQERVDATGAGWTIAQWPDDDAMLDQLVALTAPENAAELRRRASVARTALEDERRAALPPGTLYDDLRAARRETAEIGEAQRRAIHAAACLALGVEPPVPAPPPAVETAPPPPPVPRRRFAWTDMLRFFRGPTGPR